MRPTNEFVAFTEMDLEQSMAARFEQQARRYPNHPAVKSKYSSLTYSELDRRANRVARAILACDENAGSPVALLGKQGVAMVVASLGALKAGKPYAPIDYQWPPAKTIETLAQLSTALVLVDNDNFAPCRELAVSGLRVINIEDLDGPFSDSAPAPVIAADRTAYIHFTSGSTGEPKGVAASHRAELHNIAKNANALKISPRDRVSLLRSNNAGAARDTWLTLLNGATLCPLELREEGLTTLGQWLNQEAITVFSCVTTIYRQAIRALPDNERLKSVRLIHVGGEPVTPGDVELYKKHFADDCKLVVRYSISETPAISYFFIDKKTAINSEPVPVGKPLAGNDVSILDEDGHEVGAGMIGEIAVKSRYLATGYWRQPELTAQKFIADPGGGDARIYHTGDLGYLRTDGCLVHTGRKDLQAKVRGYRVDVDAVEAILRRYPYVDQVVVNFEADPQGGGRLYAYVAARKKLPLKVSDLRSFAAARLPSYMMPSAFTIVDHFPTTASGKIDRRALKRPERVRRSKKAAAGYRQCALERIIVELWQEVLKREDVGTDDDFMDLGGDSLLGARMVALINNAFSPKAPLANIFQAPTVADLIRYVRANEAVPGKAEKVAAIWLQVAGMSDLEVAQALKRKTIT